MSDPALAANEVDIADVTSEPGETVPVKLVSGEAVVAAPGAGLAGSPGRVTSDLMCPLLVDEDEKSRITVVEQLTNQAGESAGRVVHRVPEQVVETPVGCPSCGKIVERHMLVFSPVTGERDCAIAINARANPKYTALFGGDAKAWAEAGAEAESRGDRGKARIVKVLGPQALDAEPALEHSTIRQPVHPQDVPSQNLSDEAKANLAGASDAPVEPADETPAETKAPLYTPPAE